MHVALPLWLDLALGDTSERMKGLLFQKIVRTTMYLPGWDPTFSLNAIVPLMIPRRLNVKTCANHRDHVRRSVLVAGIRQARRGHENDSVEAGGLLGEVRPPRRWYDILPLVVFDFRTWRKGARIL